MKINDNQWKSMKSMVLVLLKILRYPVVPDRVQKARKHKKIFSNFLRHFRNVRFRGAKVFPPVWSGLPATSCLADFVKSPKTLKINENQWKPMKINENSEGTGRINGSDQQILRFRNFAKFFIFFGKFWIDPAGNIKDCTRIRMRFPRHEDFVAHIWL